jgi:hypothetical protein
MVETILVKTKVWRRQRSNLKSLIEGQTIQWTIEKEQTMIYKTLHRKLKIEELNTHTQTGVHYTEN